MGIIKRLERVFGSLIEGFFRQKMPRKIQPIEIGRALIISLEKNRQVSVARTYAPNSYVVYLNGEDLAHIQCVATTLTTELKGVLRDKAERDKLSFVGEIELEFREDAALSVGTSRVVASFQEEETDSELMNSNVEVDTRIFHITNPSQPSPHLPCTARLVFQSDPPLNRAIQVVDGLTIGRGPSCHVRLEDNNVSRIHARLHHHKESWIIQDNHSTNGTFLNGLRVTRSVLHHGDKIQIGTTILVFEERD